MILSIFICILMIISSIFVIICIKMHKMIKKLKYYDKEFFFSFKRSKTLQKNKSDFTVFFFQRIWRLRSKKIFLVYYNNSSCNQSLTPFFITLLHQCHSKVKNPERQIPCRRKFSTNFFIEFGFE